MLASWHPDWSASLRWSVALFAALAFFVSILLHELSHALVGRALGISVSGITLFMFGGVAHLDHEPKRASAELWMALVGPLTSLIIAAPDSARAGERLGARAHVDAPRGRDTRRDRAAQRLPSLPPEADATEALRLLKNGEVLELLVVSGNRLLGLVRWQDVLRYLSLRTGAEAV